MSTIHFFPMANVLMAVFLVALVIWKNPKSLISGAFGLGALCVAIVELGHFMSLLASQGSRVLFWFKFALAGACFLPLTWSLFSVLLLQPDPKGILRKRRGYLLFLLVVGVCFLAFVPSGHLVCSLSETEISSLGAVRLGITGRWFLIYLLSTVMVMLLVLENTYRNARQGTARHALLGLMGSLFYTIFVISQGLLFSRIPSAVFLGGSVVVFLAGLLMAYDIFRHRLFQVEIHVGREVIYSLAILILVGAYLILVGLVGKFVGSVGGNLSLFFTIMASFFMIALFLAILVSGSLKKRLRAFIDRNFYKGQYDYREQWLRFSEEMSCLLDLEELLPRFLQMMRETLEVRRACILLPDCSREAFLLAEAQGLSTEELRIPEKSEFLEWLFVLGKPFTLVDDRFKESLALEVLSQRDRFRSLGLAVLVPLISKRKLMGLLALGPKDASASYSSVDLELLEAMANHLSVAILNAKLSQELVLSKELEFIHKLSSFVIHDLKNAVSTLSMILQNAVANIEKPEFRESMITTIAGTVEKMKDLMGKITTMPTDFRLDLQPHDLNSIVRAVVAKTKVDELVDIRYVENLNPIPLTWIDREYVEQVLTNLIVNAVEAMDQAGTLRISTRLMENGSKPAAGDGGLRAASQFVEIEVADTGLGMSDEFITHRLFKPFQTTKGKGLGIGLYQCKEAVEAHNGRIEVRSKEGEGTIFLIRLPVVHSASHREILLVGGNENRYR